MSVFMSPMAMQTDLVAQSPSRMCGVIAQRTTIAPGHTLKQKLDALSELSSPSGGQLRASSDESSASEKLDLGADAHSPAQATKQKTREAIALATRGEVHDAHLQRAHGHDARQAQASSQQHTRSVSQLEQICAIKRRAPPAHLEREGTSQQQAKSVSQLSQRLSYAGADVIRLQSSVDTAMPSAHLREGPDAQQDWAKTLQCNSSHKELDGDSFRSHLQPQRSGEARGKQRG